MIIGISGYAGSGKNTVATIIQYLMCHNTDDVSIEDVLKDYLSHGWWLEEQSGWEQKSFAKPLKTIASILTGIPEHKFDDQEFKKSNLGPEWNITEPYNSYAPWVGDNEVIEVPMTIRELLQKLGTDAVRNNVHPDAWLNAVMCDYKSDNKQNWIITDVRFRNEAKAIKAKGGIIIRVDRPDVKPINPHASETELDSYKFDYLIANVSDITALTATVKHILQKENII